MTRSDTGISDRGIRETLRQSIEANWFQRLLIIVICANAIILGLETSPRIMAHAGAVINILDQTILFLFLIEITIKLFVYQRRFWNDGWRIFDFFIIGVALLPGGENLSIIRALRVLRILRLMSMAPRMRKVVQALLSAIPAMGAVITLLLLFFYVFGVMATKLFGEAFPEWFGTIGASLYSLFQIMTLESWSMGIVRPVMTTHPYAWAFFVPFILMTTFAVMNLFVAIVVNSMQGAHETEMDASAKRQEDILNDLHTQITQMRQELATLRTQTEKEDDQI